MRESEPSIAFLQDLLHELKDPFAALHGGLDLYARSAGLQEEQRERLQSSLRRSSEMMRTVLDDASTYLRLLASAPDPRTEEIELSTFLGEIATRLKPGLETREQRLSVDADELWFCSDRELLGRCLSCLLASLSRSAASGARWALQAGRLAETLSFDCRFEPGTGAMPEAGLEPPSERADYRRLLAERLSDLLSAELAWNEGGGCTLTLPFRSADPAAGADPGRPAAPSRPHRVLVVDDNIDGADTMAMWLEAHGFEVATAYDGESGLLEFLRFEPDIGLFDVGLPRKNGYELAREVRAHGFGGTLIAITGYGQKRDRAEALAAGFDHHLVKPVDLERLFPLLSVARKPAARVRVVVVEDNLLALNVVVRMLERLGATAIGCSSAEEGLAAISDDTPDLVLCDLGLPGGMDGYDLAGRLREAADTRSLRLMALTGDAAASAQRALAAGFDQVLDKPIDEATLRDLLHPTS